MHLLPIARATHALVGRGLPAKAPVYSNPEKHTGIFAIRCNLTVTCPGYSEGFEHVLIGRSAQFLTCFEYCGTASKQTLYE